MTSAELIAKLQEIDPAGTTPVSIDNAAVTSINMLPAYYDGWLNVVEYESDLPIRGHRTPHGSKIWIESEWVSELGAYSDFKIEYKSDKERLRYEARDIQNRSEHRERDKDCDKRYFCDWVFQKIQTTVRPIPLAWVDRIKKAAEEFFESNRMGPDDWKVMPDRISKGKGCPADRMAEWWEEEVSVNWDDYSRIIITRMSRPVDTLLVDSQQIAALMEKSAHSNSSSNWCGVCYACGRLMAAGIPHICPSPAVAEDTNALLP